MTILDGVRGDRTETGANLDFRGNNPLHTGITWTCRDGRGFCMRSSLQVDDHFCGHGLMRERGNVRTPGEALTSRGKAVFRPGDRASSPTWSCENSSSTLTRPYEEHFNASN